MKNVFINIFTLFNIFSLASSKKLIITFKENSIIPFEVLSSNIETFHIGNLYGAIINDPPYDKEYYESLDGIQSVEQDNEISIEPVEPILNTTYTVDAVKQWGLDRINQPKLPLDNVYDPYYNGKDVNVYVLDTGIRKTHIEFQDRVEKGYNFVNNNNNPADGNGHGTHVSSTVMGSTVGVSNQAKVVPVKVLSDSGSGFTSHVIKGIQWSVDQYKKNKKCSIISMSLGGSKSKTLNDAVNKAVESGVLVVVSSGNSNTDACNFSPASADLAVSVGSTTRNDLRSYFSNYGKCMDILAPGSDILGASNLNDKTYTVKSGTSMACPHVAGVAAMLMEEHGCSNLDFIKSELTRLSVKNIIKDVPSNLNNLLLQVPDKGAPVPTPAPTSVCKYKCSRRKNKRKCRRVRNCDCKWFNKKCILNDTSEPTLAPTSSPTVSCEDICKNQKNKNICIGMPCCDCEWVNKKCRLSNLD